MECHSGLGAACCATADRFVRFARAVLVATVILRFAQGADGGAADALLQEGLADAKAGKLDEAATVFRHGRQLYPQDARFPSELAGVEYLRKDTTRAKKWLLEAVNLAPDDAYANEFLGTLYQMDGNLPATLKYWNRVNKPFLTGVTFTANAGLAAAYRARLFQFSAGQIFTLARLRATEENLARADVLASARIDLLGDGSGYRAIVQAQPLALPLKGWLAWVLPMLRELPYEGLVFDRYDIGGQGADLFSLGRWDPNKRRVSVQWRAPVRGKPRSEYQVWVDGRDELWDLSSIMGLGVKSASAGGDYITAVTDRLQWTVGANLERHTFDQPGFPDTWQAMLNDRFDYDLWQLPEHRIAVSSWGLFDVGRTNGRLAVMRGGFKGEWFPEAKGELYRLTSQAQAGRIFGQAPVDELFQLGMERDTEPDLWLRGLVSTKDGRKGSGLLGRNYAIWQTTLERRFFHIPLVTFSAGAFFDMGRAWNGEFGIAEEGVSYDAGAQLHVKTVGGMGLTLVYGRDLSSGRGAFYTAVSR